MKRIHRRDFLKTAALAATAASVNSPPLRAQGPAPASTARLEPSAAKLPRWRGFNLLEKFTKRRESNPGFREEDFQVTLAWMRDQLELWKEAGWGWALWNLRGSFGVLDSGRADVSYEDFRGHKLDREMLTLLQQF